MCTRSSHGKTSTRLLSVAVAALLMFMPPAGMAQSPGPAPTDPNFEIDQPADALDNASWPGDDWQTVYVCGPGIGHSDPACTTLGGMNASLINTTGVLHDHDQRTIFWKGGSKDTRDVTDWEWTNGSVPDKDEISHAGAAAYKDGTDLIMYIFADRFSNDGDAQMGAWFFQDAVDTVENPNRPGQGSFSGHHKNGDILWLGHFSGGGVITSMQVLKWNDPNPPAGDPAADPTCTDQNTSLPNQVKGTNLCLIAEGPSGPNYFASVTTDTQAQADRESPWDYTPKQGEPGFFPYNSFMEGGINITQLLGSTPCFSSFLIETRSSTSVTAQLKDFVLGRIDTCKIDVRKSCTSTLNPDGESLDHHFVIEARNVGYADLTSVDLTDDHHTPSSWTWTGTLSPNGWQTVADYTINNTTQGVTNTVTAVGRTSGGYATAPATSDPAICPNVPVNPLLEVTKECDKTSLVVDTTEDPNRLWVQVSYKGTVCNNGDVRLTNLTAWDMRDPDGAGPAEPVKYDITSLSTTSLNPGQCASYTENYFPTVPVGDGVTQQYNVGSECFAPGSSAQQWIDEVDAQADSVLAGTVDAVLSKQKTCPLCPQPDCSQP